MCVAHNVLILYKIMNVTTILLTVGVILGIAGCVICAIVDMCMIARTRHTADNEETHLLP